MPAPEKPQDPREDLRLAGNVVLIALALFAGAYRIAANRPGSFGPRAVGVLEMIGVCLGFPLVVGLFPPVDAFQARNAMLVWHGLWILLMIQFVCSKLGSAHRHSHEIGAPWAGRAEPLVIGLGSIALLATCGPGAALFFFGGGVCHALQLQLIRARFRRQGQLVFDQRLEAEHLRRTLG